MSVTRRDIAEALDRAPSKAAWKDAARRERVIETARLVLPSIPRVVHIDSATIRYVPPDEAITAAFEVAEQFERRVESLRYQGATATSAPSPQGSAAGTSRSSPADASAESVPGSGTEPYPPESRW